MNGSPINKFYFDCKKFVNKVLGGSFTESDLKWIAEQARLVTESFLFFSQTLDPKANVTAKLHHLAHIADSIRLFGPPVHHLTFRHERNHQFAKRIVRVSLSYKVNFVVVVMFAVFIL